ncbi:sulfate ABC transporter, periplasmic sulfate-binding protein [Parvibaculum lavamentivorans DS-1]|uniref:Sulfate ABC transporter, periplasmic sulfate-binding protein n=1 Tax=Parvibaculum lavamentivorans (strain DS-1 / DSM 13023 / NCIMB 13966) TaxID=402881 RepID=A7HUV8_PARL1|nr:sulfate ABC transporter, periplasmic sulfate-binding protein [Parvibaculum lavamentivorans DS-1]
MTFSDLTKRSAVLLAGIFLLLAMTFEVRAETTLLNVSYDPTRELYRDFNAAFVEHWKKETGETVSIEQSHGGSGKQARAVIDGLEADVVTLALAGDIDEIADATGKLPKDWQKSLPYNSSPYTSTIVFLVRDGNPEGIKDWDDLVKPGIEVITPNPKTSGGARWNYLAAYAYALEHSGNDDAKAREFVGKLFRNVPVLDTGARGSTTTFVQRGIGDVFISWENEAFLAQKEFPGKFEIVVPTLSIRAEPPVAIVTGNTDKRGTTKLARAYLEYLYSSTGQNLAAKHFYRPVKPEFADKEDLKRFPTVKLVSIDDVFGGWVKAQPEHFGDGGVFDQIYQPGR